MTDSPFLPPVAPGGSGQGAAGNTISLSIPTGFGSESGSLNLGFNFGGSPSDMAATAYDYLKESFASDDAFLGTALGNSQQFLSGIAAPVIANIAQTQSINNGLLPKIFDWLSKAGTSTQASISGLYSSGIAAEQNIAATTANANASIASNSGGSDSWCFITTAVCDTLHLPDDNPILARLRAFRDVYMGHCEELRDMVRDYYAIAPAMVRKIAARADAARIHIIMLAGFLIPACNAIDTCDYALALNLYRGLVGFTRKVAGEAIE